MTNLDRFATELTGISIINRPQRKGGVNVLSFDHEIEDGWTLKDSLTFRAAAGPMPHLDHVVDEIAEMCGLTPNEARLAYEIWTGEQITVGGQPSDRLAQLIYPDAPFETTKEKHRVKQNVKTIWRGMQAKLSEHWAAEPEQRKSKRLRSSDEDSRRLIIGGPRQWGPQVRHPDLSVHVRRVSARSATS